MSADAARHWADTWARAWREHDAEAIAALYADNCLFRSEPFRDADDPGRYARWAFADEAAAEVRFGRPIVAGDRATVEYWAVSTSHDGREETIAGVSLLRFGPDGLVVEQRDYWNTSPGAREPHEQFGR